MATLRDFIRAQSTLPAGSTIRASLENPLLGGGGGGTVIVNQIELFHAEIDEESVIATFESQPYLIYLDEGID